MRFEFNPKTGNYTYLDNPYVELIKRRYDKIKTESRTEESLRDIIDTFVSVSLSPTTKAAYFSNTLKTLEALSAVERKLSLPPLILQSNESLLETL